MHVIVWQFTIAEEQCKAFIAAYGPQGDWATLFRKASGYGGTTLLQANDNPLQFLTLDHWDRDADYQRFQEQFSEEYRTLDVQMEGLTLTETKIGAFDAPE